MSDSTPAGDVSPTRWSRKRWFIVGSVGVVAAVVVALIVFVRLTRPALVTAQELDSALLDTAQINTIMGATGLQVDEVQLAPAMPTSRLSKPECLGALTAAQAPTYAASGYTGFRWAGTSEPGEKIDHYVAQAVAVFPTIDTAKAFVKDSADHWKACAEQTVAALFANNSAMVWKLGTLSGEPPKIAISETREDVGWTCQRALHVVSNVVVDATACGASITDQGSAIADAIAANVSK